MKGKNRKKSRRSNFEMESTLEEDCAIKWKKISNSEFNIFLDCDGTDVDVLLGSCTYDISSQKWKAHPDFRPAGTGYLDDPRNTEYYSEIEAGRALKKIWISTKNYTDYQNHLNNSIPISTRDSDYEISDEEWESIFSDFSLDGN